MAISAQLLKQIRNAAATVTLKTDNPEFKALLTAADVALNTLLLQDSPGFYLHYIAEGKALLQEGTVLAKQLAHATLTPVSPPGDLHASLRFEVIEADIASLHRALADIVNVLDERRSADEKAFLVRLSDWESGLYQHHLEQISSAPEAAPTPITAASLQTYLRAKSPERENLLVTSFAVLDGGFSKKTILFETEDALLGRQALVVRAEQPVDLLCFEGSDVTQEFYMIQLMRKAGLPIAEPLWLEADRSQLGTRFIVSRKAEGKTYGGNLGSDQALAPALVRSMVGTFIAMHNIKVDPTDPLTQHSHLKEWLPHANSLQATTRHYVSEFLPRLIHLTDIPPSPQLQRGLKWLENNIPDSDEAPVIVHIDFALNNLIIDNNRITAVLDWESSRLGDPAEDIIWTHQSLAAYLDLPEFLRLYKAGTGRDVSPQRLAYARVSKCALNAITCFSAMRALDQHDTAHINMSILAYKYLALFGAQFNSLIAAAELLKT
jgi:aminoglycoside phosphotransferase (APT) family kinase protein